MIFNVKNFILEIRDELSSIKESFLNFIFNLNAFFKKDKPSLAPSVPEVSSSLKKVAGMLDAPLKDLLEVQKRAENNVQFKRFFTERSSQPVLEHPKKKPISAKMV